jgi:hypothetical protein
MGGCCAKRKKEGKSYINYFESEKCTVFFSMGLKNLLRYSVALKLEFCFR